MIESREPNPDYFDYSDFEMIFRHSAIGMALLGLDGRWLKVNPALVQLFGFTETELIRMNFQDLTHPEDLPMGMEAMLDLREGRVGSVQFEKRYVHRNGRIIHALLNSSSVKDRMGKPKYLVSQIQDISERKRAELQAKLIVESTFDGYWDWLVQEDYMYMSSRFWEMFGYEPSTKKHHPSEWLRIIFDEDREKTLENFKRHIDSKGEFPFYQESRFRHADGTTAWVLCKGAVIEWDKNNRPIRMVGTHTDITGLKNAEQALAQSSKMVALGEMAGGIAHEINSPLAVIMGHANRLRALSEGGRLSVEEVLNSCEKLEKTSMRISRIVRGLRIYSREIDNEELVDILVSELLEDTLSFCVEKFKSHGVDLHLTIEPQGAFARCRPVQISQVLLNLLNNAFDAVKAAQDKWIRVRVIQNQGGAHICVTDSGPGVPKAIKHKIMEPFFTTKPVGVGTGLGLSICTGIISAHGGELYLDESEPHTTFCLTLPSQD